MPRKIAKQSDKQDQETTPNLPAEPNTSEPISWEQAQYPRIPKITYAKAFELITVKGLSYREAAAIIGVKHPSLWEFCKTHDIPTKDAFEKYKKNKANILDAKGMQLLESLTTSDIKEKASPYQRVGMYGILYDKARLERGESTQNVAYRDISENLAEIDKEIAELQGTIGSESASGIDAEIALLEGELGEDE